MAAIVLIRVVEERRIKTRNRERVREKNRESLSLSQVRERERERERGQPWTFTKVWKRENYVLGIVGWFRGTITEITPFI